jgi:crossover junction endodeoxyribonuclease RuvC
VFITESTFGLPIYRWDATGAVIADIVDWWRRSGESGKTSVLFCYTIGKAQRLLSELARVTDRPVLLACGEIALGSEAPFALRLARLHAAIVAVAQEHRPAEAAVEAPFHGISARSALQLAHARGVVIAALAASGLTVVEYSPATVKKAVTGNGRAEKAQVQAMFAATEGDAIITSAAVKRPASV